MIQLLDFTSAFAEIQRASLVTLLDPLALRCSQCSLRPRRESLQRHTISYVEPRIGTLEVRNEAGCHGWVYAPSRLTVV